MRARDARKIRVGDLVTLKLNLGQGEIVDIALDPPTEQKRGGPPVDGKYPMYKFRDLVTSAEVWCTYKVIIQHDKPEEVDQ